MFNFLKGIPHAVVANVLDYDIVVSKFKLQLHYYSQFWTDTFEKDIISFIHVCPTPKLLVK